MASRQSEIGIDCGLCRRRLLPAKFACFFRKAENEVYISVKNQFVEAAMKKLVIKKEGTKYVVNCSSCQTSVGVQLPFGPHGSNFISFGKKKVIVGGIRCEPRDKISVKLIRRFGHVIEQVDMSNFYGRPIVSEFTGWSSLIARTAVIRFASTAEHFEWSDLLASEKVPRPYQIEAFAEALQRDLVLVLPTGSGKTLVAALLLARMRAINPGLMGALLVERVPLVFQQAKALEVDTGLRVAALCGENMTTWKIRELLDGAHDLVVITAGALLSLLKNRRVPDLSAFSCIVIDECHHANSYCHNFQAVLSVHRKLPDGRRPRLLGLTASPVEPGDCLKEGAQKLQTFLAHFSSNCVALRPTEAAEAAEQVQTEIRVCSQTELQIQFSEDAMQVLRESNNSLDFGLPLGKAGILPRNQLRNVAGQLRNLIYSDLPQFRQNREQMRDLLCILAAIEVSEVVGVAKAEAILQDLRCLSSDKMKFRSDPSWAKDVSMRMQILEMEAASLESVNEESRLLVLTWTRRTARLVHARLSERFRSLKPQLVVGRGGTDGMDWEGEQSVAVSKFNEGFSRLIVSTAVLEEGLDVSACDIVVRFDAPNSLVQLLQSRGRARKKNSRFIVIVDEKEAAAAKELHEREKLLNELVKEHSLNSGVPSEKTKEVVRHFTVQSVQAIEARPLLKVGGSMGRQLVVQVYSSVLQLDSKDMEDHLKEEIEAKSHLKVHRIDLLQYDAENNCLPSGVFPPDTTTAVVCFTSASAEPILSAYHSFARCWSFRIAGRPLFFIPDIRLAEPSPGDNNSSETIKSDHNLTGVALGQFQTEIKLVESLRVTEGNVSLQIDSTRGLLTVFLGASEISLTLSIAAGTNGFAFVDWSQGLLVIPIRVAPTVSKISRGNDDLTINDWTFNDIFSDPASVESDLDETVRRHLNSNPVLILHLPAAESAEPLDWMRLRAAFPVPLLDTRLELLGTGSHLTDPLPPILHCPHVPEFLSAPSEAEFGCRWLAQALIDSRQFCITKEAANNLSNRITDAATGAGESWQKNLIRLSHALLALSADSGHNAFLTDVFGRKLRSILNILENGANDAGKAVADSLVPAGSVLVKRAAVTPTRVVLFPAIPVASSRLLRRIPPDRLVLVAFTDESCGPVRGGGNVASSALVGDRFRRVLLDGLLLAGRHYRFFSASSGQLRASRCYFVAAETIEEVQRLRDQLVEKPDKFRSVSKYLSRLGLFHTSDTPVAELAHHQVSRCADRRARNNDLVTDGSGKISTALADSIAAQLQLPYTPSAYQFRFAGAKGVLTTVLNDDPELGSNHGISLRPSTEKFESSDNKLCIVGAYQCGPLFLNREIITLLEALSYQCSNWNPAQHLRSILDSELRRTAEALANPADAAAALCNFIDQPASSKSRVLNVAKHFDMLTDPHWLGLLRCMFRFRLLDLRKRAALPVGKLGCRVMAAPDPLQVLSEGEVFLRIRRHPSDQVEQIEGPVLVYRNPCLHPGDVRVVRAVSCPELAGWINLLLFPSRSDCSSSLAADCSGGDLDGDQFGVVWDPELIPPLEAIQKPLNYADLAAGEPLLPEGANVTDPERLATFCAQNFANSFLGRVANLHLAVCDQLPGGALNQLAIKVASAQSIAVDFPKTGIVPEVPERAVKLVQGKGYPDFMERSVSYSSEKLLGQLYRRCCSCDLDWDILDVSNCSNERFEVTWPGHEFFLNSAQRLHQLYRCDLRALMAQWGTKNEREFELGRCFQWHPLLRAERGRAHTAMRLAFEALGNKYRRIFDQLAGDNHDQRRAQAAAWFSVAYRNQDLHKQKMKPRGLSFPWVISDVLCDIRAHSMTVQSPLTDTALQGSQVGGGIETSIGRSVFAYFRDSLQGLRDAVGRADAAAALVDGRLSLHCPGVLKCRVYGSASIFLCDENVSDIDLCVLPQPKATSESFLPVEVAVLGEVNCHRHWLETLVWPALDASVLEKTRHLDREVPLIRCRLCLDGGEDIDEGQQCDVTMNHIGLGKTRHLLSLYSRSPWRLPLFRLLVQWARAAGIVPSADDSQALMPTAEFYALMLYCLPDCDTDGDDPDLIDLPLTEHLALLVDRLNCDIEANFARIGSYMLQFFRSCTELNDFVRYTWKKVKSAPEVHITAEVVRGAAELANIAIRCLTYSHDAAALLSLVRAMSGRSGRAVRLTQRLPGLLSDEMMRSLQFHEIRLRLTTGCDALHLEEITGSRRLFLRASGAPSAIDRLRTELRELASRFGLSGNWTRKYRNTNPYFLEGGGIILGTRCLSDSCRVELRDYFDLVNAEHRLHDTCVPLLLGTDGVDMATWADEAARRLFNLVCSQFIRLRQSKSTEPQLSLVSDLEFSVRPGRIYFLNTTSGLPEGRRSLSISELSAALAAGRKFRKRSERSEFIHRAAPEAAAASSCNEPMVSLGNPNDKLRGASLPIQLEKAAKPRHRKRYRLGVGFLAGIAADLKKLRTDTIVKVYEKALKSLKFIETTEVQQKFVTGWKVSVRLSASYEVHLQHDLELRLVRVYERPLNCIYANILDSDRPGERDSLNEIAKLSKGTGVMNIQQDTVTASRSESTENEVNRQGKKKRNKKYTSARRKEGRTTEQKAAAGESEVTRATGDEVQNDSEAGRFVAEAGYQELLDMRIGLTACRPLQAGSDMHRALFPDGEEFPYLARDPGTGKVVVSDRVPKSVIVLARRERSIVRRFHRPDEGAWPMVCVTIGSLHMGGDTQTEPQPVCDISLHFNPEPLLAAARDGRFGELGGYCRRAMRLSLELTNALKQQIGLMTSAGDA